MRHNRWQGNAIKGLGVEDNEAYARQFSDLGEAERRRDAPVAAE